MSITKPACLLSFVFILLLLFYFPLHSTTFTPYPKPTTFNHKHHPNSHTIIDITNFRFLIRPDICSTAPLAMVFMVHSAPKNRRARDAIRSSWGRWSS